MSSGIGLQKSFHGDAMPSFSPPPHAPITRDIIINKSWSILTNFEFVFQGFFSCVCVCVRECAHVRARACACKYITRAASQLHSVSEGTAMTCDSLVLISVCLSGFIFRIF